MEPEDVSGDAGQEIVLVCQAEGNPSPSYRWFRNQDSSKVWIFPSKHLLAFVELAN